MSNDNDKPFWWPLVEEAGINPKLWEPVREGDITRPEEMSLLSQGWASTDRDPLTIGRKYSKYDPPRIRRKKVKMVTWRLCANLRTPPNDSGYICMSRKVQWIQSDKIKAPWCALETQTDPFETVKTLPEGEEP